MESVNGNIKNCRFDIAKSQIDAMFNKWRQAGFSNKAMMEALKGSELHGFYSKIKKLMEGHIHLGKCILIEKEKRRAIHFDAAEMKCRRNGGKLSSFDELLRLASTILTSNIGNEFSWNGNSKGMVRNFSGELSWDHVLGTAILEKDFRCVMRSE